MATISPLNLTPLSSSYGSTTAGQVVTPVTPAGGGDELELQGSVTILRIETAGTGSTVTLNSVELSNFGTDVDITVTMAATQIRAVAIKNDNRFKNANGRLGLTYTSVTTMNLEAYYVS